MTASIRSVEYFNANVEDRPAAAYEILTQIAAGRVNLLAFSAVPTGSQHMQLVLFPEDAGRLAEVAEKRGIRISGPFRAFLIQGDDRLGAIADIHRTLADAAVNVFASTGVTSGEGKFGYLIYVRPADYANAANALRV